ncbi:MAG TPA: hypothetical protein PLS67_11405, partial [Accumulibacter sp.]|nr:hypothetical protein [Accumulibacter sp.]
MIFLCLAWRHSAPQCQWRPSNEGTDLLRQVLNNNDTRERVKGGTDVASDVGQSAACSRGPNAPGVRCVSAQRRIQNPFTPSAKLKSAVEQSPENG